MVIMYGVDWVIIFFNFLGDKMKVFVKIVFGASAVFGLYCSLSACAPTPVRRTTVRVTPARANTRRVTASPVRTARRAPAAPTHRR